MADSVNILLKERLSALETVDLVKKPKVVKKLGLGAVLFLQQLHELMSFESSIDVITEGGKWICRSYTEWSKEIELISECSVRRAVSNLKSLGIILRKKLSDNKLNQTYYYSIDYDQLKKIISED